MRATTLYLLAVLLLSACASESVDQNPAPAETDSEDTFSVVTLNIWHDQDDWPARLALITERLEALAPDVICLQEVLQRPGLPNQAQTLADSLGYRYYFASVDGPESEKRYGNAILSRHPIAEESWKALRPKDDYRTAAHVRIAYDDYSIDVYNTHLHYSGEGAGEEVRRTQIQDLLAFVDSTRAEGAAILAGDFNTPPSASELEFVTERFGDAYAAVHPEAEDVTTLNPHFGHEERRIDYVFFERDVRLAPQEAEILFREAATDSVWASDHFGVLARFAWPDTPVEDGH